MSEGDDETQESISRILSGSSVIFAGSLVNKGISFAASVFMASILGDTGYGMVALVLTFYFVLSKLFELGLPDGVARNYPRAETDAERRGMLVTPFLVTLPLSVVGAAALFLAADPIAVRIFDDPDVAPVLRIIAIAIPFNVLLDLALGALRAVQRPVERSLTQSILFPIVRFGLIVLLVVLGYGSAGAAAAYVGAALVTALLALYYVHRHTSLFAFDTPATLQPRSLLSFSIPLMGSTIIVNLMNNVDTFLVGALATATGDVGQYNAAFVLAQISLLFYTSLGFMYVPEVSRLHAEEGREQARAVYQAMTKWILFASLPFTLTALVYPEFVMTFVYTPVYRQAALPFVVLTLGLLTHVVVGHNNNTLLALGNTRAILLVDVVTLLINVVLNVTLIPVYGILGAAVATAAAYVVRNVALTGYLYAAHGIQPFTRPLLATAVLPVAVAAAVVVAAVTPSLLVVVLTTVALVVVTAVSYLRYGVSGADLLLVDRVESQFDVDLDPLRDVHDALR